MEDDHPGIIDRENFQRVQELIAARKERFYRGSTPSDSVYTGHIFCGHCGCPSAWDKARAESMHPLLFSRMSTRFCPEMFAISLSMSDKKTCATDTLPFKQVKNRGQKPRYQVEDDHPGIIDRENFPQLPFPDAPKLIQQGLEEFSGVERQFVVQPQGGSGEHCFGNLGDGTQLFAVVAAVADPMHHSTGHFFAAGTAAMSAEDVPGVDRGGPGGTADFCCGAPRSGAHGYHQAAE